MKKPKEFGADAAPQVHTASESPQVTVDPSAVYGGNNMKIIKQDTHIMALADRSARAFCSNYRPWGMDVDDVRSRIWECYAVAESKIVCHPVGSPEREAAARTAIAYALNRCRDESKANRVRIQPFQIRKAYERGENLDRAYNALGEDIVNVYCHGSSEAQKRRYLRIALHHMEATDAAICRAYLKHCSWAKVAAQFGYSEGDFRRKVMPGLKERAQAVWRKVW